MALLGGETALVFLPIVAPRLQLGFTVRKIICTLSIYSALSALACDAFAMPFCAGNAAKEDIRRAASLLADLKENGGSSSQLSRSTTRLLLKKGVVQNGRTNTEGMFYQLITIAEQIRKQSDKDHEREFRRHGAALSVQLYEAMTSRLAKVIQFIEDHGGTNPLSIESQILILRRGAADEKFAKYFGKYFSIVSKDPNTIFEVNVGFDDQSRTLPSLTNWLLFTSEEVRRGDNWQP